MLSVVFREISHKWGDFSNSKYERRHVYVNPEIYDSGKKKTTFFIYVYDDIWIKTASVP